MRVVNRIKNNFKMDVNQSIFINLPIIEDLRGNLAFAQNDNLPFDLKRIYYLFDIPSTASRGGHSHKAQSEILIALSGSFEVTIMDGTNEKTVLLNKPAVGFLIPPGLWRELQNFSSGAVCLVLASDVFDESDYVRKFNEFLKLK